MAKRESKGQQVKTFKYYEAQEDGTFEEKTAKVYFNATEGDFTIYLPEHMHKVVEVLPMFAHNEFIGGGGKARLNSGGQSIWSKVIDTVIEAFKSINTQYFQHLTELTAVKVIRVTVQANVPYSRERAEKGQFVFHGSSSVGANDISFCGFPAVHLTYSILWRSGDKLYRKVEHDAWGDRPAYSILRYDSDPFLHIREAKARAKVEASIIPWTAEREEFLCNTVNKIIELGWMLKDFVGDFEKNIDYALASGTGQLALAPPTSDPTSSLAKGTPT